MLTNQLFKDITIVTVTHNSENVITSFLETLDRRFNLCVIDNASKDKTRLILKKAKYKNLKLIFNKIGLGFGTAANLGIRKSKTKYICLHNSNLIFIIPGSVRRRSSVHPSDILAVTGVLMKEGTLGASKGRNGSITSNESIDSLTKANTEANMFSGRRRTIKDMKKNYSKNKGN